MARMGGGLVVLAAVSALAGCEGSAENSRRLGALEQKVSSLSREKAGVAAEAAGLRDAAAELSRTVTKLEAELRVAAAGGAALKAEMADLDGSLAELRASNASMAKELESLKKSVAAVAPPEIVPQYPVEPVLKMLGHSDHTIRDSASRILRRLADPASVGPLVAIAEGKADPATRRFAVAAMGAFKDPRVQRVLTKAVDDANYDVRRAAYDAMGQIAAGALVGPLLKALDREVKKAAGKYSYEVESIANALSRFEDARAGRALVKLMASADDRTLRSVARAYSRVRNPQLVPDTAALLKKLGEPRQGDGFPPQSHLMQVISRVGTDAAAAAVLEGMASANAHFRGVATGALGKVTGRASVPAVAKALETGKSPGGRALAPGELAAIVKALVKLGDGRAAGALLARAKGPDANVAREAASGLAKCVDAKLAGGIITAWKECKDGSVKGRLEGTLKSGAYPVHWDDKKKTFAVGAKAPQKAAKEKKAPGKKKAGVEEEGF